MSILLTGKHPTFNYLPSKYKVSDSQTNPEMSTSGNPYGVQNMNSLRSNYEILIAFRRSWELSMQG